MFIGLPYQPTDSSSEWITCLSHQSPSGFHQRRSALTAGGFLLWILVVCKLWRGLDMQMGMIDLLRPWKSAPAEGGGGRRRAAATSGWAGRTAVQQRRSAAAAQLSPAQRIEPHIPFLCVHVCVCVAELRLISEEQAQTTQVNCPNAARLHCV